VEKLREMKLAKAAEIVANGIGETLSACPPSTGAACTPTTRWNADARDPTTNARRRRLPRWQLSPDADRRTPRHVASTRWGSKRYLQMNRLAEVIAIA
jgi:hypothetical protein